MAIRKIIVLLGLCFIIGIAFSACDVTTGADSCIDPSHCQSNGGNLGNSTSVVGSPSISAQYIENVLSSNGSPAKGTGYDLYNYGVQYNIDPAFALAFFKHESSYGLYGVAYSHHSLGNLRCISGYACVGGFASFPSWQDGYAAWYQLISGPVYVGSGLTTVGQITQKYAPSGDGNDPYGYAQSVEATVQAYRQG